MLDWIHSNWDKIVTVGSLLLNVLGGFGIVPPLRKPKQAPSVDDD